MLNPSYMSPTPCPLNQTSARTRLTLLNRCWSAAVGAVDVVARVLLCRARAGTMEGPHPLAQCPSLRLHQVSEVTESHQVYGQSRAPDTCSGKMDH